jgi:hypothetical protein
MAIYHYSMTGEPPRRPKCRGCDRLSGGKPVTNEHENVWYEFIRMTGVVHTEIVLPEGSQTKWVASAKRR